MNQRLARELVDGVVSSAVFAAFFYLGTKVLSRSGPSVPGNLVDGLQGVGAGVLVWGGLYAFWSYLPRDLHAVLGAAPLGFGMNLAVMMLAGLSLQLILRSGC